MAVSIRIANLIKYFGLSNAEFSEKVGIQISTISHLISGRNNPSMELILKIKNQFPSISLDWLLLGTGSIEMTNYESVEKSSPTPTPSNSLEIEQIIIFYKNGQFKKYST